MCYSEYQQELRGSKEYNKRVFNEETFTEIWTEFGKLIWVIEAQENAQQQGAVISADLKGHRK